MLCSTDNDESGDEAFDDDVNKRKEQLYAETIDDAGLSTLYRVDDEQKGQEEEDNKKEDDDTSNEASLSILNRKLLNINNIIGSR